MQPFVRFACVLSIALVSCLARGAEVPAPSVLAQAAWVRAPAPGSDVASVYLVLRNTGARPVIVVAAKSPVAHQAMLHQTKIEAGQARMRPQDRVVVAPGGTVAFEPGGLHIMLHGISKPLTVGATVPIALVLDSGQVVSVVATVRPTTSQ